MGITMFLANLRKRFDCPKKARLSMSKAYLCIDCENMSESSGREESCPVCGSRSFVKVENWLRNATLIADYESRSYFKVAANG